MFSYNYTLSIISLTQYRSSTAFCGMPPRSPCSLGRSPSTSPSQVSCISYLRLIILPFLLVLLLPARPCHATFPVCVIFAICFVYQSFPLFFAIFPTERDPRRKQVLEEPRPNISFVLCNACVTSPALVVLKDADIIAGKPRSFRLFCSCCYIFLNCESRTWTTRFPVLALYLCYCHCLIPLDSIHVVFRFITFTHYVLLKLFPIIYKQRR